MDHFISLFYSKFTPYFCFFLALCCCLVIRENNKDWSTKILHVLKKKKKNMVWIKIYHVINTCLTRQLLPRVYFSSLFPPESLCFDITKTFLGSCNEGPGAPETTITRRYQIMQWYQPPKRNLSKKQIGAFHKMLSYSFNIQQSAGWTYVSLPLQSSSDARIKPTS